MRKLTAILLSLALLLSMSACSEAADRQEETETIEAQQGGAVPSAPAQESEENEAELGTVQAVYYRSDDTAEHLIEDKATVREGFEPQDLIDLLIEKAVLPEGIKVNAWGIDESDVMNIDFNSAFEEALAGSGTAGEYIMMGSTVNTLINNFSLSGVAVTVEGQAPATGHNIYDYVQEMYEYEGAEA